MESNALDGSLSLAADRTAFDNASPTSCVIEKRETTLSCVASIPLSYFLVEYPGSDVVGETHSCYATKNFKIMNPPNVLIVI